jgi:hypothetical protein
MEKVTSLDVETNKTFGRLLIMDIRWSFFDHIKDNEPKERHMDWPAFATQFSQHQTVSIKHDVPAFSMKIYKDGGTRGNDAIHSMSGAVLDFDGESPKAVTLKRAASALNGYSYVGYTTFSHTEEAPRFRLVIPFTEPVSADDFRDRFFPVLMDFLMEKLDSPLDELDKNCPIPSKIYDLPCVREGSTPDSIICNGSFLIPELFITKHHAWQALKNIKHDVHYPQWITIGMALHAGLGDEGFAVWNEWSSWGSNYPKVKPEKELASHWKSFNVKEKGVSLGTLFHMAKYHPGERVGGHGQNISASLAEQIVHFLKEIGEPCLPKVIAFGLNKKTENEQGTIRKMLHRLYERGTIHRNSQGAYVDKNDLFKATINVAGHLMCNMAVCGGKKTNFFTLLVTRTGGGKDSIARNMSSFWSIKAGAIIWNPTL